MSKTATGGGGGGAATTTTTTLDTTRTSSLVDHYNLLCAEHRVRKANSVLLSLFRRFDEGLLTMDDPAAQAVTLAEIEQIPNGLPVRKNMGSAADPEKKTDGSVGPASSLVSADSMLISPSTDAQGRVRIRRLTIVGNYIGNHAIAALLQLLRESPHLSGVQFLSLRGGRIYAGNERPTSIQGNHLIKFMCQMLYAHPSLLILDVGDNEIATEAYLWLVEFCKSAVSVERLLLDGTLLQQHEALHLSSLLHRNILFHRTTQVLPPSSSAAGASVKLSPEDRRELAQAEFFGKSSSSVADPSPVRQPTYLEQQASMATPAIIAQTTLASPTGGAIARGTASELALMEAAKTRQVEGVKKLTPQLAAFLLQPHVRPYHKTPEQRAYLRRMLQSSPLHHLLLSPSSLSPALQRAADHETKVRVLNFEEREVVRQREAEEARKAERVADTVEFIVSVLLRASYEDGEIVCEQGDASQWVFFVGPGGKVESADGSTSFGEGCFFGEEELLEDDFEDSWCRKTTFIARPTPFDDDAGEEYENVDEDRVSGDGEKKKRKPSMELYQLRREVFVKLFARPLASQRSAFRRFTEGVPAFVGLTSFTKSRMCDSLYRTRYQDGEVITLAPTEHIFIVVDGTILIRRTDDEKAEPKQMIRGELIAFSEMTNTATTELTAVTGSVLDVPGASSNTGMPTMWILPVHDLHSLMPLEAVAQLKKNRKVWWQ